MPSGRTGRATRSGFSCLLPSSAALANGDQVRTGRGRVDVPLAFRPAAVASGVQDQQFPALALNQTAPERSPILGVERKPVNRGDLAGPDIQAVTGRLVAVL